VSNLFRIHSVHEIHDEGLECDPIEIRVVYARSSADQNLVAIHLLDPDQDEISDAVDSACRDLFDLIVIHSAKTWPNKAVSS
jgi:hypothetical protein